MTVTTQNFSLADEFGAAIEWWRNAGVDCDFADDATDWLEVEDAPAPKSLNPENTKSALETQPEKKSQSQQILPENGAPTDLKAFRSWWLEEPALDGLSPRGRVSARGEEGAQLMVLVLDPEAPDKDQLLSGPRGNLLAKILKASGIEEDAIYFASVLPRHTPMADGRMLVQQGYADVLKLHIKLARPKRICAFGSHILPLLSHGATGEVTKEAGSLQEINHDNRTTPLFAAESLEGLMGSPSLKARFWRRWVKWSERLN